MKRFASLCLFLTITAGCGAAASAGSSALAPESISWAPALQVDLPAMERTSAGVYTRDLVVGDGPQVRRGARVSVYFAGFLPDGTQIDAVAPPAAPVEFELGAGTVIRGWESGILGMRAGGQRQLVVPAALAYGGRRVGQVPPNSNLVFIIKLVSAR
ncbi:MAG TPA: FKBP-type peptidyl-prolyl cis-trans isomerase [Longimicrobium sp.]|nr:FKBP-type peptidyl-prolyl cis-trans isomerase [Longimicrobium sp.]